MLLSVAWIPRIDLTPYLAALTPVFAISITVWADQKRRAGRIKAPQKEMLLRPPGYSLSLKLERIAYAVIPQTLLACGLCSLAGLTLATAVKLPGVYRVVFGVGGAVFAGGGVFAMSRIYKLLCEIRNLQLGLRGEQAVAEALQEAAGFGFRSFHDFPAERDWNIDHVVVGQQGVLLIETKARNRIRRIDGNKETHKVYIHGNSLRFPVGEDRNAIAQAERNGKWLSTFLSKETGERVVVEALVVLPGWFCETKEPPASGVKVMNTKYLVGHLQRRPSKLPRSQVQRITTALDNKCRDVEF